MKKVKDSINSFMDFVREQGVVGLAVGFILGGAISKVVASLVLDIINPGLGIVLGATGNLQEAYVAVGPARIMWGSFVSTLIDFLVVASVVYFGIKKLGLDRLDKKKS